MAFTPEAVDDRWKDHTNMILDPNTSARERVRYLREMKLAGVENIHHNTIPYSIDELLTKNEEYLAQTGEAARRARISLFIAYSFGFGTAALLQYVGLLHFS